jgi:hypothetical protein
MAKTIVTRIKNKVDTYENWKGTTGLLDGEIAIVRVTTEEVAPTGEVVHKPALLMKVGAKDTSGNPIAFDDLPWLSAKASDVYAWAKKGTAEEVPVTIDGKASTLRAYLAKVDTNAGGVAANLEAINTLKGPDTADGSVAKAIKEAIAALDANPEQGSGNFVKAVTQVDGKITVTKGTIAESDLPSIGSDKITTGDPTYDTLDTMLSHINSEIAGFAGKLSAEDRDSDSGSGNYVKGVTYSNGKITVTKGGIELADVPAVDADHIQANAVTTAKIVDGNVTDAKIASVSAAKVSYADANNPNIKTLPDKIADVEAQISSINTAIAGGVHFIGTTTTDVTTDTNKLSNAVTISSKSVEANQGDIVIYSTREFIWTGSVWEELGDVTRIGNLETKINDLDVADTNAVAATHQFVSQVTQTDGKIAVTYTQPTSADVSHDSKTVKAALEDLAANKSDNTHTHSSYENQNAFSSIKVGDITVEADTTTAAVEFVGSNITITPDATNDKITFAVAKADADGETGIVTLEDSIVNQSTTAATSKAVYSVNANAVDAQTRVGAVEATYVRVDTVNSKDTLVWSHSGTVEEIIFDCGGAPQA